MTEFLVERKVGSNLLLSSLPGLLFSVTLCLGGRFLFFVRRIVRCIVCDKTNARSSAISRALIANSMVLAQVHHALASMTRRPQPLEKYL